MNAKNGFSLIELMLVVMIIGWAVFSFWTRRRATHV